MRLNNLFTCVLMTFMTVTTGFSQQDPEFTQYMFNRLYYNPAYSGVEGITKASVHMKSKWTGYGTTYDGAGGAPTTQMFTLSAPIFKFNSGFGAYIMNDHLGVHNNLSFMASYAYHVAVSEGKLSFGVKAGFFSQSIDFNGYRPTDPNDPLIGEGKDTQVRPDFGGGVNYESQKVFVSLGVAHLSSPSFNFGSDSLRNSLEMNANLMGGYRYEVNYDLFVTPSILVQSDFRQYTVDISVIASYDDDKFWGGISYKHQEAVAIILGMSFMKDKAMRFGYAFDYIVMDQEAKQPTSHELKLSYALAVNPFGSRKVVRTPRFRH